MAYLPLIEAIILLFFSFFRAMMSQVLASLNVTSTSKLLPIGRNSLVFTSKAVSEAMSLTWINQEVLKKSYKKSKYGIR